MVMIANARRPARHEGPRSCIRADGIPKRAWPTRRMAHHYGRQVWGKSFQTYLCPCCLRWHNATKVEA